MKYTLEITIPANTPEATPVVSTCQIIEPWLVGYEIYFPQGCAGLARVQIIIENELIAPRVGSGVPWFRGEGSIVWQGRYKIALGQPQGKIVTARGWNEDDTYPHTPLIRFDTSEV